MAFLGIPIKHETGRLLSGIDVPGTKMGASELHITVLCFEDNWPISEIAKALEAAYDVISDIKPFIISVDTVTCFPKRGDKPCPIIAPVQSDDLHDLSDKLRKEFDKRDIDYSKIFKEFKPHITLSYADEEVDKFKIDKLEFSVQEIVLWGGDNADDRVFVTFPLKGPRKTKNSKLLDKVELFYKMANETPNSFMMSSYERCKIKR